LLGRLTELGIFTTIQKMFQYKITQHPDACKRIQVTFNEIGVAQFATCGEVVGAKHGAKKSANSWRIESATAGNRPGNLRQCLDGVHRKNAKHHRFPVGSCTAQVQHLFQQQWH
jgi:hypothetical protein